MNDTPTGRAPVSEILDSLTSDLAPSRVTGADVVQRARRRTRVRRAASVGTASLAVAALAGVVGTIGLPGGDDGGDGVASEADGGRWVTSMGLETRVPADWPINPLCPQGPSVVRNVGMAPLVKCVPPPEDARLTTVVLDAVPDENGRLPDPEEGVAWSTWTPTTLKGGQKALRASATLKDGRSVTALSLPAGSVPGTAAGAAITVTDADPELTDDILGSVRVVGERDTVGCAGASPGSPAVLASGTPAPMLAVPDDVTAASVCQYDGFGRIAASDRLDAQQTEALVAALKAAPAGINPPPDLSLVSCLKDADRAGVQLRLTRAGGERTDVWVAYQLCTSRYGMSDGTATAQVTEDVLTAALQPLHHGFSVDFTVAKG